jgi:hypothetical protein
MNFFRVFIAMSLFISSSMQAFATNCFDQPRIFPSHTLPGQIVLGDLNGDGRTDFVAPFQGQCESGPGMMVFLGKGDGTFQSQVITDSHAAPWSLTLADLNADGRLDILAAYGGCGGAASTLDVLIGNGDGTFKVPQRYQAGLEPDAAVAGISTMTAYWMCWSQMAMAANTCSLETATGLCARGSEFLT